MTQKDYKQKKCECIPATANCCSFYTANKNRHQAFASGIYRAYGL